MTDWIIGEEVITDPIEIVLQQLRDARVFNWRRINLTAGATVIRFDEDGASDEAVDILTAGGFRRRALSTP